jgi:DNA segregation ATPase FtsK/SpoIIIE, S-DNA-T family
MTFTMENEALPAPNNNLSLGESARSDLLFDLERSSLSDLLRFLDARRRAEVELIHHFEQAETAAVKQHGKTLAALQEQHQQELDALDARFEQEQYQVNARDEAEDAANQRVLQDGRRKLEADEKQSRERLKSELQDSLWTADSMLEAGQRRLQEYRDKVEHKAAECAARGEELWKEILPTLARVQLDREDMQPPGAVPAAEGETLRDVQALVARAETQVKQAKEVPLLRWITWSAQLGVTFSYCTLASLPALFFKPWYFWLGGGMAVGVVLAVFCGMFLHNLAQRRLTRLGRGLAILIHQANTLAAAVRALAESTCKTQLEELQQKHVRARQKADNRYRPQMEELKQRIETERDAVEQKYTNVQQARRQRLRLLREQSRQNEDIIRTALVAHQKQTLLETKDSHNERMRTLRQERSDAEQRVRGDWQTACYKFLGAMAELEQAGARSFDDEPAQSLAPGLQCGTVTVDLPVLVGDLAPETLDPLPHRALKVPAFLPFPRSSALLLKTHTTGRTVAIQALQALMLRFLTTLPPGKVRFTILDPVGLGDNFAAFMHLSDIDEALITSRIWTEANHIEKQLADLTLHMENVIQKYLRRQFSTIEDYNAQAGEVAEPYRVLVVANFPVNFTPAAARRLVSIVQSGGSCGVYALISADVRQTLPQGVAYEELEAAAVTLTWEGTRFIWNDPELDCFPLQLDTPPESNVVIDAVRRVGEQSRAASKVQVPFSYIAPTEEQIWRTDSRSGVTVPLGRAGAVRRMSLQLGRGTSQHVLIAGKTGSGKSTLLHALITNLALYYSPDEVELYLIDFKKGVEFKMYAQCELPHARVIAIESEREFGLSVLQRLDAELRQRGDLFRSAGVNDIASYRQSQPKARCPRILLIVDEFQEFFVEDDRLAQESALLMDRLVRQGRAFGLHVLLGSQTLGGAYSLARSTIDQMAVRIALQCSETDAQLILNKDNSAARLLSRPGEAIYNDSSGSLEGNEVFQVVWLPEEERERVLRTVRQRAGDSYQPALVFESNAPADFEHNPLLLRLLAGETSILTGRGDRAWLGEAIAIKDPTAAEFRPRTGHNLLIVGQHEEAALALLTAGLVSLAAQHGPAAVAAGRTPARFVVLDGTGVDDANADFLLRVTTGWPLEMKRPDRTEVAAVLASLAEELNQRLKGTWTDRGNRYLLIHGLQRFREFRRVEDDFSFGRRGAEKVVSPLEHLQALLRDGPSVGMHVLLWCDLLTNLNRTLDRQGLRECGLRVVFQMNAADSSHLLDSPLASRLGRNRALYFHDEMAQPEKFRPYGLPSLAWLEEVKRRLG